MAIWQFSSNKGGLDQIYNRVRVQETWDSKTPYMGLTYGLNIKPKASSLVSQVGWIIILSWHQQDLAESCAALVPLDFLILWTRALV